MAAASVPTTPLRIGDVARLVGTTTRTIRYYEERGLLATGPERVSGQHRLYAPADVERLREIMRLKDLLGVSLEELTQLVEAEDARALLRREWHEQDPTTSRRREMLTEALGHIDAQLALVRRRHAEIKTLSSELETRRRRVKRRMKELEAE
jgi:DNA-binding transcriptional MerR regulator